MAAQQLAQLISEPARLAVFSDGSQFWQCPRCRGYYNTEAQASTTLENRRGRWDNEWHRCRSRPPRQNGGANK